MPEDRLNDLNDTDIEAPGGSQTTHSSAEDAATRADVGLSGDQGLAGAGMTAPGTSYTEGDFGTLARNEETGGTEGISPEGDLGETGDGSVRGFRNRIGRDRVAERVERFSDNLEERARAFEMRGGIRGKAAPVIDRASRVAESGAAYVREHDLRDMRSDLEREIREHPLKSLVIALGCGYLLAKLLD